MKQAINFTSFEDAFKKIRPDNFSYEGLVVLFNYLEDLEEQTEQAIDLDVIALCCEFSEATIEEVLSDYNLGSIDDLDNRTIVLRIDHDRIIYQNF